MDTKNTPKALKAVALLELSKGAFALLGGIWFFATLGEDWTLATDSLIKRFAPSLTLPDRIVGFLGAFDRDQQFIAASALLLYAILHLIEGYGLWKSLRWAEWLGTISGGIYIPFEIWELIEHPSWITASILAINALVVGYLIYVIKTNPRRGLAIS